MASKTSKTKKKVQNEVKTQIKKKPWLIIVAIFLIASAVGGFFLAQTLTKNDTFEIIGQKTVYLSVGDTYEEAGAKAVSLGRDISASIKTESTVNTQTAGEYYVKYTVEDIRFGNVCRYRYVIVQEVGNEG